MSKKLGAQRVSCSPAAIDMRRVGAAKGEMAQAVNTSSIVCTMPTAPRELRRRLRAFTPYASSGDGAMVLNRDEAKELFRVIAEHSG